MGIQEKIKEIEFEMSRTQKNKATEYHLGTLKAKLAKLRTQLFAPVTNAGGPGIGFAVQKYGHARVALIGFPSVGKSSLLSLLTDTKSEVASYEFTTLSCIPGTLEVYGTKIQILDLPGIIQGASEGRGKGRQVIAVAKSADLIMMVLDATKDETQKIKLETELEAVGIRLNRNPPDIRITRKNTGGIKVSTTSRTNKIDVKEITNILSVYKVHNAEIVIREENPTVDDIIDVIEGNRVYVKCLYVYNKIDMLSISQLESWVKRIAINEIVNLKNNQNNTNQMNTDLHESTQTGNLILPISIFKKWNIDILIERVWSLLGIVRVYTKKKSKLPDFDLPVILTHQRGGYTILACMRQLHKSLSDDFKYAIIWGSSGKHSPQVVGRDHSLHDEDVVQIMKKRTQ